MNFSTFTVPCNYSWYVSDSGPDMQEACPELYSGPQVHLIPEAFLHQLFMVQIEKNLGMDESFHYIAKLVEENLK